ncbi:TIGR02281 family clan AA aspartic protease [uncultured Hyphomonas sp.]|uniref:retropepsin-like aspartic protease family protein n=1 Tax=uncultured Hyphomonas sp. TaxID=225298 RepID=UPI003748441A
MLAAALIIAATVVFFVVPKTEAMDGATPAAASLTNSGTPDISSTPRANFDKAAIISREADGHYWTRADVQGTDVRFMVDTGASIVALTLHDAQRIGLSPSDLEFDNEIRTAGGITQGAYVVLDRVRIGRVEMEDVSAMVLREGLEQSLLGMSFLGELYSYEFKGDTLIIRQ